MNISYDAVKNAKNIEERGISFDMAAELDWSGAVIYKDDRRDYGEDRYIVKGYINNRLHVLVFTPRGDNTHIISLRKANKREVTSHEQES